MLELGSGERIPSWIRMYTGNSPRNRQHVDLPSVSFLTLESGQEFHIINRNYRTFDVYFESLSYQIAPRENSSAFTSEIHFTHFAGDAYPTVEYIFEVQNIVSCLEYTNLGKNCA